MKTGLQRWLANLLARFTRRSSGSRRPSANHPPVDALTRTQLGQALNRGLSVVDETIERGNRPNP